MTVLGRPAGGFSSQVKQWEPDADGSGDLAAERARALAHATLVQTSLKVANLRAAVQSRLLDARTEAEEMIDAARVEADKIRRQARDDADAIHERALIEARHNTIQITDRALDRRDVLVIGAVEMIANLSTSLLGMADQLIANSVDQQLAEHQLSSFMLALTDMVPDFRDTGLATGAPGGDPRASRGDGDQMAA